MDEQNQELIQNLPPQVPQPPQEVPASGTPWLKYAEIVFFGLAIFNIGLFYFYYSSKTKSALPDSLIGTEDSGGFLLTKPDQSISRDGYTITFSSPRYEHADEQSAFRVDVVLVNESFEPSIKVIANCDIVEENVVVKEGVGISIETGEANEVSPGNSTSWTALVALDNRNQKVSSCIYAPQGVFDPKQTIRVIF